MLQAHGEYVKALLFHANIAPPNRPALLDVNTESMILRAVTNQQQVLGGGGRENKRMQDA